MNVATQIVATIGIREYGIGNHVAIVGASGVTRSTLIFVWVSSSVALIAIGWGKVAAVYLVLEIQGKTRPTGRLILLIIAAVNVRILAPIFWRRANTGTGNRDDCGSNRRVSCLL